MRTTRKAGPKVIATTQGNSYDDYNVPKGHLTYQILVDGRSVDSSNAVTVSSRPPLRSRNFKTFDNTKPSSLKTISKIKLGNTYYQYNIESDKDAMSQIVESTSVDGYTFEGKRVVLTRKEICQGSSDGFCKLEAVSFQQNPQSLEVVMWAHWENKQDYSQARVAVAFGKPGGDWVSGGSFRPLGYDSRDLSFFIDDEGSGYLISSTSMNTDMNIYQLSSDWHDVASLVTTVLKGQRREAPALIKHENSYYLFTSQAAGWYPSAGQYISATSLSGPWSESRQIGNLAGFGAQSGGVERLGSTWVMRANMWSAQWQDPEPPNRQIVLPISLSDGFASYHFYQRLRYFEDDSRGSVYGIQSGKVLSLGRIGSTAEGSVKGHEEFRATDGIELDPANFYQASTVPFSFTVDLGASYHPSQFDLTTKLVGGSETAYQFTIMGAQSMTQPFDTIVDKRKNTRVGFVTSSVDSRPYRYIRLDVQSILNVHNKHDANWAAGITQFKVYGWKARRENRVQTTGEIELD